jgi:hypothetical protein
MRVALYVFMLVGSGIVLAGQQPIADPYELVPVRSAMDRLSLGIGFGGDAKALPRLGDRCSIAILKIMDQRDLSNPKKAAVIASMIHWAFAFPESITNAADKDPKVSLFLLDYLLEKVPDAEVQRRIRETIEFVKVQTQPDSSAPTHSDH